MSEIGRKAGSAAILLFARKAWGGIINIGVLAYLARVLPKEDFGIVAVSGVLLSIISALLVSGIGDYLIFYHGKNKSEITGAAFWMNMLGTLLVSVIAIATAPLWANYYGDRRIVHIVYLLVASFFAGSWGVIPRALFRKKMNYKPIVYAETLKTTFNSICSLGLAVSGMGIYSLVLPNVISSMAVSYYLFRVSSFRMQLRLHTSYWSQIFRYIRHVIGTRIMGRLANEGDTLIVGKLLGMEALGVYNLAFKMANMLNAQILPVITSISFPVLSDSKGNHAIMKERFFKMISLIAFVMIPLGGAMMVFAEPIIYLLYSAKWHDVVLPFRLLVVFALFRAVSSPASGLYNALGRPDIGFKFTLVFVPVLLLGVVIAGEYGLITVVAVVTLIRVAGSIINTKMAVKLLGINLKDVYDKISAVLTSTMILSTAVSFVLFITGPTVLMWSVLAVFYLILIYFISRTIFIKDSYLLSIAGNTHSSFMSVIRKVYFLK